MKSIIPILMLFLAASSPEVTGQSLSENRLKNYVFLQLNNHLEKRGTKDYYTGNPDLVISYERLLWNFGRNNLLAGLRTGAYREYVLTGYGWDHPTHTRPFIGLSPSYRVDVSRRIKIQVNMVWDVLIPNDYDEIWSYYALEPVFNFYFTDHLYAGISAAMGVYYFFDPRAYMDKAGIKIGYAFGR